MLPVVRRLLRVVLPVAFVLSLLFVPFRHRTLVTTPAGGFDFRQERVWAPLWRQPGFSSGVAEYPLAWLLGVWGALAVAGGALWAVDRAAGRRRP